MSRASEQLKRKRKNCSHCQLFIGWFGEEWERRKAIFNDLGQKTLSNRQKTFKGKKKTKQLTAHQRSALCSILFTDEGECLLCRNCFCEFTNTSLDVRRSFLELLKKQRRIDFVLEPQLLKHKNTGNLNHSFSSSIFDDVREFCFNGNLLHWDPRSCTICFNIDVNSWDCLFRAFTHFVTLKYPLLHNISSIKCRQTFATMVRNVFPGLKVGRQQHTSDACDVCVEYWKKKKSFAQWLATTNNQEEYPERKGEFLNEYKTWDIHLEFAYHERQYYQGNCLLAVKQRGEIAEMEKNGKNITSLLLASVLHLSVDAMRIRYLPHIGLSPEAHSLYFLMKLKMYLMGIVDEGKGYGYGIVWDDTNGSTTTNHVLTSIWIYILKHHRQEETLRLTMDNCGVNKSYLMVAFAVAFVFLGYFKCVMIDWLVVGHTKFSPDRLFGIISQLLKKSDYFSRQDVAQLVNQKINTFCGAEITTNIIDFSTELFKYFRYQKFLSEKGMIGIKKLQGIKVERKENRIITWGIERHELGQDHIEILKKRHENNGPILQNPFAETKIEKIIKEFSRPDIPKAVEYEIVTIKRNVNLNNIIWPVQGEVWQTIERKGLPTRLIKDLWIASGLTVSEYKSEYHEIWESLSKEEVEFLSKHKNVLLDVSEGITSVRQTMEKLRQTSTQKPQQRREEKGRISGEEENEDEDDEDDRDRDGVEDGNDDDEDKDDKDEDEDENEDEQDDDGLRESVFEEMADVMVYDDEKINDDIVRSLCFEFSTIILNAQEEVKKESDQKGRRKRRKVEKPHRYCC